MKLVLKVLWWIFKRFGSLAAVAAVVSMIKTGDSTSLLREVERAKNKAIKDIVEGKTGMILDENDPLSDASLSAALSERSGIAISTVVDVNRLAADLAAHASGMIEDKTGVHLSNLLSVEQVKSDVVSYATGKVKERTGLDIEGAQTFDAIQARITEHVAGKLLDLVADRINAAAMDFAQPSATLDELLAMVYRASEAKSIKPRDVGLGTAASLVVAAYARQSVPLKRRVDALRRRAQNRNAQRRFRAAHGNRMRYNPVADEGDGG